MKKQCDCVSRMNRMLDEHDARVVAALDIETGQVYAAVATERTDKSRKKAVRVVATYCPFCGKKYKP